MGNAEGGYGRWYASDEDPPPRPRRAAVVLLVAGLTAAVIGVVTVTVLLGSAGPDRDRTPAALAASRAAPTTTVEPTTESAEPTLSTVPSTAATTSAPKPKRSVVPSRRPVQDTLPPPAPKPASAPANCPTYSGPAAAKADVRRQLEAASTHAFWPTSAPALRVPLNLLKAIAWQESGWQSTIIACDGGIGTMQVMRATATWANQRFGTSWDVNTLSGNVMLGGQYLAWLIKYLGDVFYQGLYDVTQDDGLLESVISAYNAGYGAVDPTKGAAGIPNPAYVASVRALMLNCPCSAY